MRIEIYKAETACFLSKAKHSDEQVVSQVLSGYQIITFWRFVQCGISVRFIISLRPNDKQKVGKTGWQTWYNDSRQHAGLDVFRI